MNGHGWRTVFAAILVAGVGAAWVANGQLASLETGLLLLNQQFNTFSTSIDNRVLYLERQSRPTAFMGDR